jgi:hypothetical protein
MKKLLLITLLLPLAGIGQLTAISVNLYKGNDLMDGVAVYYNGQSDSVDNLDIQKLTNPSANIAIINGIDTLAGEQRTSMATVDLRLWNLTLGADYRLEIVTRNINTAFLLDSSNYRYAGSFVSYPFIVTKTATNRFKIAFCPVLSIQPEIIHPRSDKAEFSVFPNPVSSSTMHLQMKNMKPGLYTINIIGSSVFTPIKFKHIGNGGQDINISRLTPGFYVALLQDQYGNRISRKIIIE